MSNKYNRLFIIFFLIFGGFLSAQTPDFGEIGPFMESLGQEQFAKYGGQILLDKGEVTLVPVGDSTLRISEYDLKVKYSFRKKIFIQNEQGLDLAHLQIPVEKGEYNEAVVNVEAVTYFLQPDSSWEVVKWDEVEMEIEEISETKDVVHIHIPNMKPGIVIEYAYQILSNNFYFLRPWHFQGDIPVRKSEFTLAFPESFVYNIVVQNQTTQIRSESEVFNQLLPKSNISYSVPKLNDTQVSIFIPGDRYSWKSYSYFAENVPAWEPIPFISTREDLIPQLRFQLASVKSPATYQGPSIESWDAVNTFFLEHPNFGGAIEDDITSAIRAKRLTFRVRNKKKRARMIYDFVRTNFGWNGELSLYTDDLENVWESNTGSGSEINLIMLNMLKAVKLEAYPVLISTRDNGKINPLYPLIDQFNHLVVVLRDGAEYVLLDGLSDVLPFGVVPRNDLNYLGFIIDKYNFGWLELFSDYMLKRRMHIRMDLLENNETRGELYGAMYEYSGATARGLLPTFQDTTDFIEDVVFRDLSNLTINQSQVIYANNLEKPLVVRCRMEVDSLVRTAEDLMFIRPMITSGLEDNPFDEESRKTPIEFNTKIEEKHYFTLRMPEGYEAVQLPHPVHVVLPNRAGSFLYNWQMDHNILQMVSEISINRRIFYPEEYPNVKVFFNYIFNKHEEDIILRRVID